MSTEGILDPSFEIRIAEFVGRRFNTVRDELELKGYKVEPANKKYEYILPPSKAYIFSFGWTDNIITKVEDVTDSVINRSYIPIRDDNLSARKLIII